MAQVTVLPVSRNNLRSVHSWAYISALVHNSMVISQCRTIWPNAKATSTQGSCLSGTVKVKYYSGESGWIWTNFELLMNLVIFQIVNFFS